MKSTGIQEHGEMAQQLATLEVRLAKAELEKGYYALLIQDTAERLRPLEGARLRDGQAVQLKTTIEECQRILIEAERQAADLVWLLQSEIERAKGGPLSLHQKLVLAIADWEALKRQIEVVKAELQTDPPALANLLIMIDRKEAAEKAIWKAEYDVRLSLLLTHEALEVLRPVVESVYAVGCRAGITNSFEDFLTATLASADGIRPDSERILAAQQEVAAALGIQQGSEE